MDEDGDGLQAAVGIGHEEVALEGVAVCGPGVFRLVIEGAVLVAEDAGEVHEVVVGGLAAVESGLTGGIVYFHLGDGGDEGVELATLLVGGEGVIGDKDQPVAAKRFGLGGKVLGQQREELAIKIAGDHFLFNIVF